MCYRAPQSWKLLYKDGSAWKEVDNTVPYGLELDKYNKVTFNPITTSELRLVAQLQSEKENSDINSREADNFKGYSAGVIEWKVNK